MARGGQAWWQGQRQGAASALTIHRIAPLASWWVGVPRAHWSAAVAARWRNAEPAAMDD